MRRRRLLAGAGLAVALAIGGGGLASFREDARAQPRGARPARAAGKPKGAASADNPYEDTTPPAPAAPAAPAPIALPEGGPFPAPPTETSDGGRLSPLTPAPNEFSEAGLAPSADYDRLLADIAALRARVAAVSDTLFHSRIAISLETSGDRARIASLTVSLDDGIVWTSPASFRAESATVVYEHALAPGHHAVTVDIERRDERGDSFRSEQRSRFVVDVPLDQRLACEIKLEDDSNMGDFASDKRGRYDLRVRAKLQAQPLGR